MAYVPNSPADDEVGATVELGVALDDVIVGAAVLVVGTSGNKI